MKNKWQGIQLEFDEENNQHKLSVYFETIVEDKDRNELVEIYKQLDELTARLRKIDTFKEWSKK